MHTRALLGSKWWHIQPKLLLSEAIVFHIPFHKCIVFHLANSKTCMEKKLDQFIWSLLQNTTALMARNLLTSSLNFCQLFLSQHCSSDQIDLPHSQLSCSHCVPFLLAFILLQRNKAVSILTITFFFPLFVLMSFHSLFATPKFMLPTPGHFECLAAFLEMLVHHTEALIILFHYLKGPT